MIGATTTTVDPLALIAAITAAVTTVLTSVGTLIVAIRNGQKTTAVQTKVDDVHDCLHRQAEDVKAIIGTQAEVATALAVSTAAEGAQAP